MARWRLTQPHYLLVPGTEWEYRETDQNTGRQARKVFEVPLFLDPNNPTDCNRAGEVIVVHGEAHGRGEYAFLGDPTPDMEPLDDEAEEISTRLAPTWQHPIETLAGNGGDYGAALIAMFEKQIAAMQVPKANTPLTGISPEAFAELQATVKQLAEQNVALQDQLVAKVEAPTARRA